MSLERGKIWQPDGMRIKVHLSGIAIAYQNYEWRPIKSPGKTEGRYQGSLFNQQKRKIADATEYLRINHVYKPRIFVATTPGFIDHQAEKGYVRKLVDNLKSTYGMEEYLWVREFTGAGFPHYHFVADVDQFDPVRLSRYWSGLFDSDARNSVRCGTAPYCRQCRIKMKRKGQACPKCNKPATVDYWIKSQGMASYLSKYIGKAVGTPEKGKRKSFRTFAVSEKLGKASAPLLYEARIMENYNGTHQREFFLNDDQVEPGVNQTVDPYQFNWKWTGHTDTYIGFPQKKDRKKQEITEDSQKNA